MERINAFRHGPTLALYAAKRGYTRNLKILIQAGVDIEVRDPDGKPQPSLFTFTHSAFFEGIENPDDEGCTPLLLAAKTGNYRAVKFLTESHANVLAW